MAVMGELAEYQKDYDQALEWYRQAVESDRIGGNLPYLASNLSGLGRVLVTVGRLSEALEAYEESLTTAGECSRADVVANATYGFARIYYEQGQNQLAETHTRQSVDLFRRLGMKREQAEAEALLARIEREANT